jgi:hypothetical protein
MEVAQRSMCCDQWLYVSSDSDDECDGSIPLCADSCTLPLLKYMTAMAIITTIAAVRNIFGLLLHRGPVHKQQHAS